MKNKEKKPSFNLNTRIQFYERLRSQMERSLPSLEAVSRIISAMKKQNMDKKSVYKAMEYVHKNMINGKNGVSLAEALKPIISEGEYMIISSSEKHGQDVSGLKEAIYMLESRKKMITAVVSALAYPSIVTIIVCGVLQFFKVNLIPIAVKMSPSETWPAVSQSMLWMSNSLLPILIFSIVAVGLFSVFLSRFLPVWTNHDIRDYFDKYFPPFLLYRTISGAMFLTALSSILKTGASAHDALDFISKGADPYMKSKVRMIQVNMINGLQVGESLSVGLFDKETNVSIDIFSKDKTFEKRLGDIAHDSVDNTIGLIKNIGQAGFYVSLIGIATVIGTMLIGFMSLATTIQ